MRAPKMDSIAIRLMDAAFAGIVKMWPADSRDWARAMHAEFYELTTAGEKFSWLLGGAMSLTSAWTQRLAFGPSRKNVPVKPVKKPGALALVFTAVAVASLALPGMWRGIITVWQTWNASAAAYSPSQLESMGHEAELKHDAKMLAFVAERLSDSPSGWHCADAAVALDPSLTWVYFERPNYWYRRIPSPDEALRRARLLEKWDPDNAVPYLMEASVAFDRHEEQWVHNTNFSSRSTEQRADELASDAAWSIPMEKAFAASRYDDFIRRSIELDIAVVREHHIDRPVDLIVAASSAQLPNLLAIQTYGAKLLHSGDLESQTGNVVAAREDYWRVANFAGLMRGSPAVSGFTITRLVSDSLAKKSFEKLRSSVRGPASDEIARLADYELATIRNDRNLISEANQGEMIRRRSASFSSITIHLASEAIAVSGLLSCVGLACFALGMGSWARIGKYVCMNARFAPFVLVASLALFYTNYLPYLSAFRTSSPDELSHAARELNGLLYVPMYFATYSRGPRFFWIGVIIIGSISAALLLARMALRTRMENVEA